MTCVVVSCLFGDKSGLYTGPECKIYDLVRYFSSMLAIGRAQPMMDVMNMNETEPIDYSWLVNKPNISSPQLSNQVTIT
jgi:hypothetical protein